MDTKNKGILLFLKNELEFLHIRKNYPNIDIKEYCRLRKEYPNVDRITLVKRIERHQKIVEIKRRLGNRNLSVSERRRLEAELRSIRLFGHGVFTKGKASVLNVRRK